MTPNSQILPSCAVTICVASVAHITLGASVMICRSCTTSGRARERCGDSRVCSRISRSTRLRDTRMPSITRRRAHTLRCPSPCQGDRARSARIASLQPQAVVRGDWSGWAASQSRPAAVRHRTMNGAPPRSGRLGQHRSGGRWPERSPPPSPRPPAAQRARPLDARTQQLVLHAQLANALHGGGKLAGRGVCLAFLQRAIEGGVGLRPPLLQLVERDAEFTRQQLGGLAAQQTQHHLALAAHTPALAWSQRTDRRPRTVRAAMTCGQRGRPSPAPADHRPITRIRQFDFAHAGLHHHCLRSDKSLSREIGGSSYSRVRSKWLRGRIPLTSAALYGHQAHRGQSPATFGSWLARTATGPGGSSAGPGEVLGWILSRTRIFLSRTRGQKYCQPGYISGFNRALSPNHRDFGRATGEFEDPDYSERVNSAASSCFLKALAWVGLRKQGLSVPGPMRRRMMVDLENSR